MKNTYLIEIKGKKVKEFLSRIFKLNINIYDIEYFRNKIIIEVDYASYEMIKSIKTSYEINIVGIKGKKYLFSFFKRYFIYFLFMFLSFIFLIILSNMIFFVNINSSNKKMTILIKEELKKNNLTIYSFKKSYNKLREIALKIKEDNKDLIEWIEIENKGVSYNIYVIPRVKTPSLDEEVVPKDLVASRNGLIIDMNIDAGEIIKNKGDYVNKGDIVVSGYIKRGDNVVGIESSKGKIYAEVWYKVKTSKKFKYNTSLFVGYSDVSYKIKIFGKEYKMFGYKVKKNVKYTKEKKYGFFNVVKSSKPKRKLIGKKYSQNELQKLLENEAEKKILSNLAKDEYIISQKTLKNSITSDKMELEIFFKVYEDIAIVKDSVKPDNLEAR